jgi:hypothetical protein
MRMENIMSIPACVERTAQSRGTGMWAQASRGAATTRLLGDGGLRVTYFAGLFMVAPQPVPPVHARHHRGDPPPRLIVADAAVSLVEQWNAELVVLRRRSPTSDAVRTLTDCIRELVDAINAGHTLTVQLTIVEARTISHIPVSTLRWLCKNKPESIGARKREGIWYIDRSQFERYLSSNENRAPAPCRSPELVTPAIIADRPVDISPDSRADLRLELR